LAASFIRRRLPGVGISIGLTRIFAKLVAEGRIQPGAKTPATLMVAVPSADMWRIATAAGRLLRARGFRVDVFVGHRQLAAQLRYAVRKGIRYVWFPPAGPEDQHEVRDLQSGEQRPADPGSWMP
jgi:histidyl-tRNA synthetase